MAGAFIAPSTMTASRANRPGGPVLPVCTASRHRHYAHGRDPFVTFAAVPRKRSECLITSAPLPGLAAPPVPPMQATKAELV